MGHTILELLESRRLLSIAVDGGFGSGGRYQVDLGGFDSADALAKQGDGRIIVAGNGASDDIFRLTATGQRDNTFVFPPDLAAQDVDFGCVAIQSDGKIVAGGRIHNPGPYGDYRPMIARFNTDGSLDKTFGNQGIALPFGAGIYGNVKSIRIRSGGNILFCGNYWGNGAGSSEYAGQVTATGALDGGFGTGGLTTFDFGGSYDEINAMQVLPDGRIVMIGWGYFGESQTGAMARLTAAGKKDTTFDGDGLKRLSTASGRDEEYEGMALRSDGNLVIVGGSTGSSDPSQNESLLVGLINADGVFQSGFGIGGRTIIDGGGDIERLNNVQIDSGGRIYAAGGVRFIPSMYSWDWDFALTRFTSSGAVDAGFNGGKVWTENFGGDYDICNGLLLDSPTHLLLSGGAGGNNTSDAVVAGYAVDAPPPPPPLNNASIAGTLWNDADADGVKDTGEASLAGWKVFLDADKDGVLDAGEKTASTDLLGNYKFSGLAAGAYRVRELTNSGWRRTSASAGYYDLTLTSTQASSGKNFGNTTNVLLSGTLWNDLDGDGIKDSGELALAGWKVFLDADKDGAFDATEKSVTTSTSGAYTFSTLPAGSYRVRAVQQSGWRRTTPSSGYFDLTLAAGASATGKNFAFTQRVLISGTVFNDLNSDRVKNSGEVGLSGWKVFIDKDNDGVLDSGERSTSTDSSGNWSFKDLAAGTTYVLRIVQQTGWKRTTPTSGNYTFTTPGSGSSFTGKLFGEHKIA